MRSIFVLALLCVGCRTETPAPKLLSSEPAKSQPSTAPVVTNAPPTNSGKATAWPERPASVMGEVRAEGLLPTAQAILNQARKVSNQIPPVEAMIGIGIGSLLGLTDMSALDVSKAAGVLLVDTPKVPSPLVYIGVSSEEGFRKALPAGSMDGDALGNALAFAPSGSRLGEQPLYLNFIGTYVFGSNSPEAFSLCKPYLEEIAKRPLGEPSIWFAVEVAGLLKRYDAEIDAGITQMKAFMPATPGMNMDVFLYGIKSLASVDDIEIRHTPAAESFHLSIYVKPASGSGFEVMMKKPMPALAGLEKKLPLGWVSGSAYADPESTKAWMLAMEAFMPAMKEMQLYPMELVGELTGEMAFSTGDVSAVVLISGVKDEEKFREGTRGLFAKEKKLSIGTQETTYSAIEKDAEKIAGFSVDKLQVKSTGGTPLPSGIDLSSQTTRFAYQPGLVITNIGTDTTLLESVLKGEASTFEASAEVKAVFAEIPKERTMALFFSVPGAVRALAPLFDPGASFPMPESKSGAAVASWVDEGRYRVEIIVPNVHIQEMITYVGVLQSKAGASENTTPASAPK